MGSLSFDIMKQRQGIVLLVLLPVASVLMEKYLVSVKEKRTSPDYIFPASALQKPTGDVTEGETFNNYEATVVDCKIEKDTAYAYKRNNKWKGYDVVQGKNNKQPSLADCIKSCKQNKKCKYWSYHKKTNYCFLKRKKAKSQKWIGYTSGSKDCDVEDQPYEPEPYDQPTEVDGGWGDWGSWSDCTNNERNKRRTRKCNNPRPSNAGAQCSGSSLQLKNCPVNGNWSMWGAWSSCSSRTEKKRRIRQCDNPTPSNGGTHCPGSSRDEADCPVADSMEMTDTAEIRDTKEEINKDCVIEENTAYKYNTIVSGKKNAQTSLSACINSCKQNTRCKFWTYVSSDGSCHLKTRKANIESMTGYTSGSRYCSVGDILDEQTKPRSPIIPVSRRPIIPVTRRPIIPVSRRPIIPVSRRPIIPDNVVSCSGAQGSERVFQIPGCGSKIIDLRCVNGCLKIIHVLYSCDQDNSETDEQLSIVQRRCENKTECQVRATRSMFGNSRCPNVDFREMSLSVRFRCDGGQDRSRMRNNPNNYCPKQQTGNEIPDEFKSSLTGIFG